MIIGFEIVVVEKEWFSYSSNILVGSNFSISYKIRK